MRSWGENRGSPKRGDGFMYPESSLPQQKYLHFLCLGLEGFCSCASLSCLCAPTCHCSAPAWSSKWTMARDLDTLHPVMQPSDNIFSSALVVGSIGIKYGGRSSGLQSRSLGCLFKGAAQT